MSAELDCSLSNGVSIGADMLKELDTSLPVFQGISRPVGLKKTRMMALLAAEQSWMTCVIVLT